MSFKPRVTSPVYCGKCGKSRGLLHTCIVRRPNGRTKVKAPKATLAKCGSCGQSYANPLTHACPSRPGDFERRKAAAEKRQRREKREQLARQRKAERARRRAQGGPQRRTGHRYDTCRDADCQRLPCRAYREGIDRGMEAARDLARR